MIPALPPGWRAEGLLGRGGFATVWAAVRERDGRRAALKLARAGTSELTRRFADEGKALVAVGPPAVPELMEEGVWDGVPYLIMERLAGETLSARLARARRPLAPDAVVDVAGAMLAALARVHARGLIHRDLKPDHVFLSGDEARLIDLGLVRDGRGPGVTATGFAVGTIEYMAPEQLRGHPIDHRADLYALGVILYELLTLHPPFIGDRLAVERGHLELRPVPPSNHADVPDTIADAVLELLAKAPAQRPPDATAAAESLRAAVHRARRARVTPVDPRARPHRSAAGAPARRPIALVHLATADVGRVLPRLRAAGGESLAVARDYLVCGFLGERGDAVADALAFAGSSSTAAAIHLITAAVQRGPRGTTVLDAAVAHPARWIPAGSWQGVLISAAAAPALPAGWQAEPADVPGFFVAASPTAIEPPMVGRDAELGTLVEAATGALAAGQSGVATVVGERGSGRTRLLAELGSRLRAAGMEVVVVAGSRDGEGPQPTTALLTDRARDGTVLLVDDADACEPAFLSAIERAASGEAPCRLWAAVAVCPPFLARHPDWGVRAAGCRRIDLEPLDAASGRVLAARMLAPAEAVPGQLLDRLWERAGTNPRVLSELATALRRSGAVRRIAGTDLWQLDAETVEELRAVPAGQWLAARELDALSQELAELALVCAVIGPTFAAAQVEDAVRQLERARAAPVMDAGVGVELLTQRGILVRTGAGLAFRSPVLHEAIEALVPAELKPMVHEVELRRWAPEAAGGDPAALTRVARHAAGAGRTAEAWTARRALADAAIRRRDYHDAERQLGLALPLCAGDARRELDCRLARAEVRRLLTDYEGACADAAAAGELAERSADCVAAVEALLIDAAVCDQTEAYATGCERVERALALAPPDLPGRVRARLANRLGVIRRRQQRDPEAVVHLEEAVRLAAVVGDHETGIGSMLLLSRVLASIGRAEEGARMLDGAIAWTVEVGDTFHQVIGLLNRINFWREQGRPDGARTDADQGTAICREMGYLQLEIWLAHNLSLALWWAGDLEDSRAAARRAHELSVRRFRERPNVTGTLQYALVLALLGDLEQAGALLERIRRSQLADTGFEAGLVLLELALGLRDPAGWEPLLETIRREGGDQEIVEALWLRGLSARRTGEPGAEAHLRAAESEARRRGGGAVAARIAASR